MNRRSGFNINRVRMRVTRTDSGGGKPCAEAYPVGGEWYADFDDLEELMSFCHKYGRILIDGDRLVIVREAP